MNSSVPQVVERVAPVLPVRSVEDALAHYEALGFEVRPHDDPHHEHAIYGFVCLGGVELHVSRVFVLDPAESMSACYLYVADADALHARWEQAEVGGRLTEPVDTPYGLREFAHVDPDGNLLRVGSPLE